MNTHQSKWLAASHKLSLIQFGCSDMHEVIGNRLPSIAYMSLCHGVLSPTLLNIYLHGSFMENVPSVISKSRVFVSAVKDTLPTRSQTLHLIGSNLHSYFKKRNVSIRFENEKDLKSLSISHDFEPSLDSQLKWNVPETFKFSSKDAGIVGVSSLVRYLSNLKPGAVLLKEGETYELKNTDQALATLLCHFLELRSYVDIEHSLTSKCRLFLNLKNVSLEDEESLLLAMELIRLKLLVSKSFNSELPNEDPKIKYERLFLRSLCMINATPSVSRCFGYEICRF
jgi:hypothetical protein